MTKKEVIKTACRICHGSCGALVYIEDGIVVEIKGDPDSPISKGKLCIKGASSLELLYHPDRLKYPLKRAGKRGEGKWNRISWEEAYDYIAENVNELKAKYGPEGIAIVQGTGRHHLHHVVRFANALGTPNWIEPGTAQCFFPRVNTGMMTYGCLPTVDYYSDINPECILVWGHNPIVSGADGVSQFKFRDAVRKGAKLIVVDPKKISIVDQSTLWLQIRPGTDAALALSMINVIISENLYDKEFVEKWTHGFEQLKQHVENYTPEWAEPITWVSADKIRAAARLFAKSKPATLEWGVALEQNINSFQTVRAVALLPGLTGNFDVPGGWMEGMHLLPDPEVYTHSLSDEVKLKRLGEAEFKVLAGAQNVFPAAHIPTVFKAINTGIPYPVRGMMLFGNNGLLGFSNTKETYKTFMSLDFMCAMDLFMTPTAELADLVLPAASWLELDQLFGIPSLADHVVLVQKKVTRTFECKADEEVLCELAQRLGLDYKAETPYDIFNAQLAVTGQNFPQFKGIQFDDLKELNYLEVPIEYRKYEKQGFKTPTKKMELYSTILDSLGLDPLPIYIEPPESPYSQPELAKEYPYILTTGGRVPYFFHSENRQMPSLRKKHPDPIADINSVTALAHGIEDGDWIYIETLRGKITQKARVSDKIDRNVVNCQHGWWFPEIKTPDHGVWESNVNILTSGDPPYDKAMGTYQLRGILCKISKNMDKK